MVDVPSESKRLVDFFARYSRVQIVVCDCTASATFRWHFTTASGSSEMLQNLARLLLARAERNLVPSEYRRWKYVLEMTPDGAADVVDWITSKIRETQMPIYWNVHAFAVHVDETAVPAVEHEQEIRFLC